MISCFLTFIIIISVFSLLSLLICRFKIHINEILFINIKMILNILARETAKFFNKIHQK